MLQYSQRAKIKLEPPKKKLPAPPSREEVIKEVVLDNIGRPDNLVEVQVRQLWNEHRYRINVYLEIKNGRRLAHSYFLLLDSPENILSYPPMDRITMDDLL
jgi:hypothetical protein